jgi:hypothetical protein
MDSGDSQVVGFFLGILGVGLIILKIWLRGRKTITRPDGTVESARSTEFYTPRQEGPASAASAPRKRQIGPTTISFGYISERHAMVNNLKQKYGNAVRIVHRGRKPEWDAWSGSRNMYSLIYEVLAKCPKCKETFSIEDFGFVDCPECGLELAVFFDDVMRKKVVTPANGEALAAPTRQGRASAPHGQSPTAPSTPEEDAREEPDNPIADRFGKIE